MRNTGHRSGWTVSLDIEVFRRRATQERHSLGMLFGHSGQGPRMPGDLRFGVLFADGRRVTNLDEPPWPAHTQRGEGDQPVMSQSSGGGGQFHYQHDLYLTPLPPDGPLTLVVEWPDQQVPESRTELDGTAIRATATQALQVWPDLPPESP
jgi:hypothetical protein